MADMELYPLPSLMAAPTFQDKHVTHKVSEGVEPGTQRVEQITTDTQVYNRYGQKMSSTTTFTVSWTV